MEFLSDLKLAIVCQYANSEQTYIKAYQTFLIPLQKSPIHTIVTIFIVWNVCEIIILLQEFIFFIPVVMCFMSVRQMYIASTFI